MKDFMKLWARIYIFNCFAYQIMQYIDSFNIINNVYILYAIVCVVVIATFSVAEITVFTLDKDKKATE